MSGHRCTGDVDSCPVCGGRRDAIEAGPLDSDVRAASDRGVAELEARVHGERRTAGTTMTRREALNWESERRRRRMRGFYSGAAS